MKRYPLAGIKLILRKWLHQDINLDSESSDTAAGQITWETKFSEIKEKYGEVDKINVVLKILEDMRKKGREQPEKFKTADTEEYWSQLDVPIFQMPNELNNALQIEIKNTKTIGELADLLT
ncbi:hypothetical protein N032_01755 [Pseudomonas syringae pv. pisi str. PP1]|uniref:hypothetical protein n=1 Tax=Pseudomonas syringae TaxID=317 RepID=UPI000463906A|nr:hypothetical protein [Pseudomonas syringae]AZG84498.1 hypothetical protein N032_01755 [Pseudomonas syringae pv. pisi str. PP1]PBP47356.1 hypothetical protein CCL10_26665 [Pseudomonas syringae]RMM29341.1 hypothetical protein ALQ81_00767 [Pseudomonas syringae pv. pisi]UZS62926.1 hypothetical protein OQB64_01625 [Pseudomonas syringae]